MSRFQTVMLAAATVLGICLRPALSDAEFEAAQRKAVAANPPGVSVMLSLPDGRTRFHQGEVIPLTAVLAGSASGVYDLNADPGTRDLPWNSDTFQCDMHTGATDPLFVYYDREFGEAYSGGGPRFEPLTAKPTEIAYTLNEWLRFETPGRYRVYLTTGRIVDSAKRHETLFFHGHAAASNAVEFEILPDDPAWDAQTLAAALPLFNAGGYDYPTQEARAAAVRTVRFLGTPAAGQAMIARYVQFTEQDFWNAAAYHQIRLGLYGFPNLPFVIKEMQSKLVDPDFPISSFFVSDLAEVQFLAAYPQTVHRSIADDPAHEKEWRDAIDRRRAALTAFSEQDRTLLATAVAAKTGRAKAISLFALLQTDFRHSGTPAHQELAQALIPVFDDLTPEEQGSLMDKDGYWKEVRGPDMVPILRRVYAGPLPNADPDSAQGFEARERQSLALHDLMELSPADGRAWLLAEIANPKTTIDLATLSSLPDQILPSLDKTLALNLENSLNHNVGDSGIESRLVERYATRAILPRLKAEYRFYGCAVDVNLLAYFLRTDPAYGAAQLEQALARRKDTGCYHSVLGDVAALHFVPDIEHVAISHLNDPDDQVAANAAEMLGTDGSPAAEAPLWARMRQWHSDWAGKAAQIEPTDADIAPVPGQLEYALTLALATAPGWLLNAAQLQTLESLCITPEARINIAAMVQGPSASVYITYSGEADKWNVAQYHSLPSLSALEHKLTQFPAGTRFQFFATSFPNQTEQAKAFGRLRLFLKKRGLQLTDNP